MRAAAACLSHTWGRGALLRAAVGAGLAFPHRQSSEGSEKAANCPQGTRWGGNHVPSDRASRAQGSSPAKDWCGVSLQGATTPGAGPIPGADPASHAPSQQLNTDTVRGGRRLCTNRKNTSNSLQNHCKATPGSPAPASLPGSAGPTAHTRHTLSRLPCGWPSEAESDIQREVNHVLFMTNDANISRVTSPQISLNALK